MAQTAKQIFDQILKNRGIEKPDSFINPAYQLHDPMLLPDIEAALKRIEFALKNDQKIVVYGDYDIDGLTATSLLIKTFRGLGADISAYIPDRFTDGYGLNKDAIKRLHEQGNNLIITVDTGSIAAAEITYAKSLGMDVIVTDHHTPKSILPKDAVAVVNPKVEGSKYPYTELAGVGVAFALVRAMQKRGIGPAEGQEKWLLDLVALGTVCDIVPLTGENRVLVYYGLKVLQQSRTKGLQTMMQLLGMDQSSIDTSDLGFKIGPRLNASGRLSHAEHSLKILLEDELESGIVEDLEKLNTERRSQQQDIYEQAIEQAAADSSPVIIVHGENWNHGVVGIVASKLVEKFQKPSFVLSIEDGTVKGSARSFGDFHLAKAIVHAEEAIEKGGGHAYAAGVTLSFDQLDKFKSLVNEYYNQHVSGDQTRHLKLAHDVELSSLAGLDFNLLELIDQLRPYGKDFPEPIFRLSDLKIVNHRSVGKSGAHLQIELGDGKQTLRGIAFNRGEIELDVNKPVSVLAGLNRNDFNGRSYLQLMVKDIEQ